MARNDIPKSAPQLSELGVKMSGGLTKQAASIPITMITKTQFDADLAAFNLTEDAFGKARQTLQAAHDVLTPAAKDLIEWLNAARPIFISHFGYRWSASWAAVGFISHTTSIPRTVEDRLGLIRSIVAFLTENPDFEVKSTNVTAVRGAAVRDVAQTAQSGVSDAEQALKDADTAREPTRETLIGDMRTLIKNLSGKLKNDDTRWLAFGLQMPATKTTPGKPTGLTAQLDMNTGGLIVGCDPEALAERYRWRGREAGSGMPFELLARSTQPVGMTKPVAPGTTLELMVQAVNGGSQGVPSDSIFFTVPVSTPEVVKQPKLETAKAVPDGNGSGNGNGTAQSHSSRSRG